MGSIFRFKQFQVDQRDCAMKINTDGVLLGAIAGFDDPKRVLDIGSGTGVISMMLAQRFENASVDAVEIDEAAYLRSKENFSNSKYSDRLGAYFGSFEDLLVDSFYDLIVSNPPFYTNSLHNPDLKKSLARHTDQEFFKKLLVFSFESLSARGSLQLVLPTELAQEVSVMATTIGFYVYKTIDVRSFEEAESIRQIIDLRKSVVTDVILGNLVIYKIKGEYTDYYKQLLAPFFLAY